MERELVFFCMYSGKNNKKQFCSIIVSSVFFNATITVYIHLHVTIQNFSLIRYTTKFAINPIISQIMIKYAYSI